MARSVWKGPFVEESLIKKVEKIKNDPVKKPIKTYVSSKHDSVRRILTFPAVYTQLGIRNPMFAPKLSLLSV